MTEMPMTKTYDLEERTFRFARDVRSLVKLLPRNLANHEDARQLIRASASVGANYIEANEALSKKDFLCRIKISRKEAKEARFFMQLLDPGKSPEAIAFRIALTQESTELMKILGSILRKSE